MRNYWERDKNEKSRDYPLSSHYGEIILDDFMIEVSEYDFSHPLVQEFIEVTRDEFTESFDDRFQNNRADLENNIIFILATQNGVLLGGGFLSRIMVNRIHKTDLSFVYNLQENGFLNFTYFVVKKEQRKIGGGSAILSFLKEKYSRFWLTSQMHNVDFYRGHELKKVREITKNEETYIFTFDKEV